MFSNLIKFKGRRNKTMKMYCMKCKKKVEAKSPAGVVLKNGRNAVKATCPVCGTKMFQIGGMK